MLRWLLIPALLFSCGCTLLPQPVHEPSVHNPFPQLVKVAVAPFLNLSTEPAVDGRLFGLAYYNELQQVPGYEVVPLGVVEETLKEHQLTLANPAEARLLAQLLDVDAVLVGAVTDFHPEYPPRCAMIVEWYTANPCFHPIPPGYGLPWGCPEEEQIPPRLVYEAELAAARAHFKSVTPLYAPLPMKEPAPLPEPPRDESGVELLSYSAVVTGQVNPAVPRAVHCPHKRCPPGAGCRASEWIEGADRPPCIENSEPVIRHVAAYNGHDSKFTEALATYLCFRDDDRLGGRQGYLQRSEDFIRFCCYLHIYETLSARGGAGQTRVVWHCPDCR
jgi:hypothetical protein